MADYVLEKKSDMTAIADAIRSKLESTETMKVKDMPSLIESIETGGTQTLGDFKVALGQFVPTNPDSANYISIPDASSIRFAIVWLNDLSILANYSDDTIMVASSRFMSNASMGWTATSSVLHYYSKGTEAKELKSVFGVQDTSTQKQIQIIGHANWKMQPETYNYMAIYV